MARQHVAVFAAQLVCAAFLVITSLRNDNFHLWMSDATLTTSVPSMASTALQSAVNEMCECEVWNPVWKVCQRTQPMCVFIDLGAADGNTFNQFLSDGFGPVENCSNGTWEAHLVEANPRFHPQLKQLETKYPGRVKASTSTAAFFCEGSTTFYLDMQSHKKNYWGSSLSSNHPDVQKSGMQNVQVHLMNVNRILFENTIASDWVKLKVDVEGAEYDILPCLARSPSASLVDQLFVEVHRPSLSLTNGTKNSLNAATSKLKALGVDIPRYSSPTL